jgi:MFS family permease
VLTRSGIFFGCLANLLVVHFAEQGWRSWRILTNTVLIPTIPLLVMIYLMPESPRYLMKHGKYRQALASFSQLQTTSLLASRDFMLTHAQLDLESRMLNGISGDVVGPTEWTVVDDRRRHSSNTMVSPGSISPGQTMPVEMTALNIVDNPGEIHQRPRDGQLSSEIVEATLPNDTVGDSIEPDLERALRQLQARNNPYCYHIGVTGYFHRLKQLWKIKRCRRALVCAAVAMISQQLTGVNAIAILGTIVWENLLLPPPSEPPIKVATDERYNAKIAAILGLAFGAANYIGGLPAYWLSDKIGRAIMLAIGLPNMAWSMLVLALLFQIDESTVRTPLVAVFAVVFVLFYAPTAGTSPFSIAAEVFPLVTREAGMAVSVAVNLLGAGVLVLVFPFVLSKIRATSALSIFAVLNLVAFALVYLLCPETKMRKLEELQDTFDLPTRWHVEYRAVYVQKHIRKNIWKYLRGRKVDPPLPFYRWAEIFHPQES